MGFEWLRVFFLRVVDDISLVLYGNTALNHITRKQEVK